MEKVSEDDGVLSAAERVGEFQATAADVPSEATVERTLPPGVLHFDPQRARRPAGPLQARGAGLIITASESISIVVASLVAGIGYHELFLGTGGAPLVFLAVGLLAAIFFSGSMRAIEANQRLRRLDSPEAIRDLTLVWLATILCVTFFAFSLKAGGSLSRGSMLTFAVLGYFAIVATRTIVLKLLVKHYRPGRIIAHQVIVIGAEGDSALEVLLSELSGAGYVAPRIVRFDARGGAREWRRELASSLTRVLSLARTTANGEICIAAGGFDDHRLRDIVIGLQVVPRAVRIIPTPPVEQLLHYPIRSIGGLHSLELQKAPLNTAQLIVKRGIDLVLGSIAIVLAAPLFLVVAVATKLDSRGPVLFKQTRLGHRGVPFAIFKFRTMTVTENGSDVKQAQANDRRVTRIGRWLRKSSIDEVPQLLNVIRGEMSLVGPRPHAVAHDDHYSTLIENYEIRQHVKPGITGWAQVNGLRGETSSNDLMRRRVEADIWYAKNASILLDLRILLLTVVEVLRQRNAY
jgi:undecaprenyl-phosphate galactose phosphotransferase/putative colanic acid biosynthesis UDP-glucose lipid carrier transferase